MKQDSLTQFIQDLKKVWGPLTTETLENSQRLLANLTKASPTEPWLAELIRQASQTEINKELYRDPEHGFVLLAHSEQEGRYRIPHDHGSGWVLYAIIQGESEMRTYSQVVSPKGEMHLVRKDAYRMKAGDCKAYVPGDIHDTRCISPAVLMFRLTSCDLKKEDLAGRLTRYPNEV